MLYHASITHACMYSYLMATYQCITISNLVHLINLLYAVHLSRQCPSWMEKFQAYQLPHWQEFQVSQNVSVVIYYLLVSFSCCMLTAGLKIFNYFDYLVVEQLPFCQLWSNKTLADMWCHFLSGLRLIRLLHIAGF